MDVIPGSEFKSFNLVSNADGAQTKITETYITVGSDQ